MNVRFNDKMILVTGVSTGIGAAMAPRFGKSGARVAVDYNSSAVQTGLSSPGDAADLAAAVLEHWGSIDVLINNAGGLVDFQVSRGSLGVTM